MYTQWIQYHPALGKGPELRALLEERVKSYQSKGQSVALAVRMMGDEEGNPFIAVFRHQDLAAQEAFRRSAQSDPTFAEFQAKVATLLARPAAVSLREVLIPAPTNLPALTAPYFVQVTQVFPIPGKGPELGTLLEEGVKVYQSAGQRSNLATLVYGSDGPFFALTTAFQDLASLESFRHGNQADPAYLARVAKLPPLMRQPAKQTLGEVLIGFPS